MAKTKNFIPDEPQEPEEVDIFALADKIFDQYGPCDAEAATEIMSHTDLAEALRITTGDYPSGIFYQALVQAGFRCLNIEGAIYWPVIVK